MAMMMGSLYNARRTAGADDDARQAAGEVAGYESRFAKIEADLSVLKWMAGFNLAIGLGVLFKLLV